MSSANSPAGDFQGASDTDHHEAASNEQAERIANRMPNLEPRRRPATKR